ncbi:hypothetical protein M422DRAFT_30288, partial [Sphaerobolus stellatus SS14]
PDGRFLASGAMDSYVYIWSTKRGSVIQRITNYASGPVTDIVWAISPNNETVLIFALADGTVHFYRPVNNHFEGTSILCAHSWAIEGIDYDPVHHRLATSAGNEIKVWDLTSTWFSTIRHYSSNHEETCRRVQFIESGNAVAATFMETSKLITWTIEPWKRISEQTLCANRTGTSRAGYSLITRDGSYILIDNVQNGVDAFSLPSAQHIATFHAPLSAHKPRHIAIDDTTSIVIHGSDKGIVYVHDFSTAAPIQTMTHSKERELVQAVTTHSQGGRTWIASGGTCDHPVVMVWKQVFLL